MRRWQDTAYGMSTTMISCGCCCWCCCCCCLLLAQTSAVRHRYQVDLTGDLPPSSLSPTYPKPYTHTPFESVSTVAEQDTAVRRDDVNTTQPGCLAACVNGCLALVEVERQTGNQEQAYKHWFWHVTWHKPETKCSCGQYLRYHMPACNTST